jgi:hypothetical protein
MKSSPRNSDCAPQKGAAERGNGRGGRKWLQGKELERRQLELTKAGRWDCDASTATLF